MPISVAWDDDKQTIIHYRFEGRWSWDEAWQAMAQAKDLSLEVPHRVDAIANLTKSIGIPRGAPVHFRNATKMRPPNRGLVVIVGVSRLIHSAKSTLERLSPNLFKGYAIADSLDEAYTIIEEAANKAQAAKPRAQ